MFQSFYAYTYWVLTLLQIPHFRHTYNTAICRRNRLPVVFLGIAVLCIFLNQELNTKYGSSILTTPKTCFFHKCFFFPLSVGNKIYKPLSFCSAWGEIPHETGAICLLWVESRMLDKRILVVEGSLGISSFSTHCFGLGFR